MSSRIETFTGRFVDPLNLSADEVVLEDIFHALGMKCRFGGMTRRFYSVASHSILVSRHPKVVELGPRWRMAALMHDANEAYLTDVPSPVKPSLWVRTGDRGDPSDPYDRGTLSTLQWKHSEFRVQNAIEVALDHLMPRRADGGSLLASPSSAAEIKHADLVALLAEARVLMASGGEEREGGEWSLPEEVRSDPWLKEAEAFVHAAADGAGLFPCPNNSPVVALATEFRNIRKEILT